MAPTFSIIIPLYNCQRYIAQCLESLKAQTLGDFEAIIVDDGSTDGGMAAARNAAGDDERFLFLSLPENRGQGAARNRALDVARGGILLLLDADDYLAPQALQRIAQRFDAQRLDELYFGAETFYEDAAAYRCITEDFQPRDDFSEVATGAELFRFFEERGQFFPHAALRALRLSMVKEHNIRFREDIIHEDLLFTMQTLLVSQRSSLLNETLYHRRIRKGSTMASPRRTLRNIEGHLVAVRFMREWMTQRAEQLDAGFIAALSHRITDYLDLCARDYLNDVTDDEKAAHLATLDGRQRMEFELDVVQRAELLREFYNSRTWRVGQAVVAAPQFIRSRIALLMRKR